MKRKKKKNKYFVNPEAVLDLHGFTKKEAQVELFDFLKKAHQRSYQKIKIITGQGWHNKDYQSILKPFIEDILEEEGYEYRNAKLNDGGRGALIVKL